MRTIHRFAIPVFLLLIAGYSCRSPEPSAATVRATRSTGGPQAAVRASRERERTRSLLRATVAVDRQAVELGERQVVQLRSLFAAGRVTEPDLLAAEAKLLQLKQALLQHEKELADAEQSTTAGGPRGTGDGEGKAEHEVHK